MPAPPISLNAVSVFRVVFTHGSASVIFYHNHPSASTDPSPPDEAVTRRLQTLLGIIDVRVLDHLIVGERIFSFSEAPYSQP